MVKRWLLPGTMLAAALLLVTGFVLAPRGMSAQEMSASPSPEMAAHPAHIHSGTCDTLGEVVYPLEDVASVSDVTARPETSGMMGSPMAGESAEQMAEATPTSMAMMENVVAQSTTTVDASLDELLGSEHAVNVHESMENISNYIACGNITGTATDGQLEIQLNELNDSGYEGMATLHDNGDGTTNVVVQLTMVDMGMSTPTS